MTSGSPWFILVGGINGAGKSTFTQDPATIETLTPDVGPALEVINPDFVTQRLRSENPRLTLRSANIKAAEECEGRVRALIKEGTQSFAIETVLSTNKYKPIVEAALARQYQVQFVYVLVGSVEEAIRRVKKRVSLKGHNVPHHKIRSRWGRSLANVRWFWDKSSQAFIFFNGERIQKPFLVASRSCDKHIEFNPDALSVLLPFSGR